jgi:hypothetical protein
MASAKNARGRWAATTKKRAKAGGKEPLLLYSTNTWLAYRISEKYYGGNHWVYVAEHFERDPNPLMGGAPPSSTPCEIYRRLRDEVDGQDSGSSAKVATNRVGLLNGAAAKFKARTIDAATRKEIESIVQTAPISDFRPLLYVMPYGPVATLVRRVNIGKKANPFWSEMIIESLPNSCFHAIEFPKSRTP